MRALLLLVLPVLCTGADLLVQSGQAVAPGNWVKITGTTGYQPAYPGFDKFNWVPYLQRSCIWSPYATLSTEPDHTMACYSFRENNWIVLYNGGEFHDEHYCPGHNEGGWSVDPATSMMYGPSCYSAGQAFDDVKTPVWRIDTIAQIATAKMTTPGPVVTMNQMNSYFDPRVHKLIWYGGGGTTTHTYEYDPDKNTYSIEQTTTGTAPGASLRQASVFYRPVDGKGYYLFGKSSSTVSNSVNAYVASTHTWNAVTVSGTPPSTRMDTACAYSTADDAALCFGGYADEDSNVTNLIDTWVLDFAGRVTGCGSPPCWVQVTPATNPTSPTGDTVFQRMTYDPESDAFLLGNVETNGTRFIYAYRFNGGPNAGYAAATPSSTYPPTAGSINRDISGGVPSLSQNISIAADSTNVYFARAEGAGPATTSGHDFYRRIYVGKIVSGTVTELPNPSAYSSISPDISGNDIEANDPGIGLVAGVPWVCWSQWNGTGSVNTDLVCKSFNGTAWSGGNVGRGSECSSSAAFCLQHVPRVVDANSLPTIAYVQATHTSVPYQDLVLVKQFNGSTWATLGTALNVGYTAINVQTVADRPSIASDGTANPWVAWTEYTLTTTSGPDQSNYTNQKMYLAHYNGSTWDIQCGGTGNVDTTNGWASNAAVTVLGGVPYVAFAERNAAGGGIANTINKLFVRKCQSGAWSTVGGTGVYLNRDQGLGWVFRPEMTNDGTNLFVSWDEQGNSQPWEQTYSLLPTGFGIIGQRVRAFVSKWSGSAWSTMGGALNADPAAGVVNRTSIAMKGATPVVASGETVFGSLRQVYEREWNSVDWGSGVVLATPAGVTGGKVVGGVLK